MKIGTLVETFSPVFLLLLWVTVTVFPHVDQEYMIMNGLPISNVTLIAMEMKNTLKVHYVTFNY